MWSMILIYHLDAGLNKWCPTSPTIQTSMKRNRSLLAEKNWLAN